MLLHYGATTEFVVYGMVAMTADLFLVMFIGVGQAIQLITLVNNGAGKHERIRHVWTISLLTGSAMGIIFTLVGEQFQK